MNIAVVGTGISGLVCAWLLRRDHAVTVYEANDYVGGHTHTHRLDGEGGERTADTGFMVFNDRTYPNFIRLLERLDVASVASDMSFSVRDESTGLEWCGRNLDAVFAQRRNLLRPSFHRMLADVLRFNRTATGLIERPDPTLTLGEYLRRGRYSAAFRDHYLIPMGAAIWSARPDEMLRFPATYFVRFFANHGMLTIDDQPRWRVVAGGSARYVDAMTRGWRDEIRLGAPIERIERTDDHVRVLARGAEPERFDHVVIAAHADQALGMLADPSEAEREILGAFPYQPNDVLLHTDASVLPRSPRAWASWNYHVERDRPGRAALSYDLTRLQHIPGPERFFATLNRPERVDPDRVIRRLQYAHPVVRPEGVAAQARWEKINGVQRTWFAGAYWGFGFHEDGLKSGLRVCEAFGLRL